MKEHTYPGFKRFLQFAILVFAILLGAGKSPLPFLSSTAALTAEAADMPGLNMKLTEANIQKVLKKYDKKNGYYILKKEISAGENISFYCYGSFIDCIDTLVHEETHAYSMDYMKNRKYAYFVGNQNTVYVGLTSVFNTKKMASSVPERLRTMRYSTYVGNPSSNLAANSQGAYGLLNEFMAYRAGLNTMVNLYPYLVSQKASPSVWITYLNECENDMLAYAEFKYYILQYLYYGKNHKTSVYNGIVKNTAFCKAYKKVESSYAKLIKDYGNILTKLRKELKSQGYTMTVTDDKILISGRGIMRYYNDYKNLVSQMGKSRYKKIHNKLLKNAG